MLLSALSVFASEGSVSVRLLGSEKPRRLDIQARSATVAQIVSALEPYLDKPVTVEAGAERKLSYEGKNVTAADALRQVAEQNRLILAGTERGYLVREASSPVVSLDVKDEDVHVIMKAIQQQCGIRNLILDPNVQGRGTFLFHDLPCETALTTVMQTLGLAAEVEENSVVVVHTPK
jgi:hypothetical protein